MRDCPKCSQVLEKCFCSYDHLELNGIKKLVKLFRYSKTEESMPSNYLIYSLKQDNRKDVVSFLADEISESIKYCMNGDFSGCIITNVPRRKKAIREFGYDHAKLLAREVSKRLSIEYVELLKSKSRKPQKSVYGQMRFENAKFAYKRKNNQIVKGKIVIIIDDIITTGSSMTNCVLLIRKLKPKRIIGACLGTAYKESYIEFEHSAF